MKKIPGPVIEFKRMCPTIVSAGHDGFSPLRAYPFDEIYVFAQRGSHRVDDRVTILAPYGEFITISNNLRLDLEVVVHRGGCMWHDRTRDLIKSGQKNWLSVFGFSDTDPRKIDPITTQILVSLPGSPSIESVYDLFPSEEWKKIKNNHIRDRPWFIDSNMCFTDNARL